jgi:hypothetical protein
VYTDREGLHSPVQDEDPTVAQRPPDREITLLIVQVLR